jgi:hypothetical protein
MELFFNVGGGLLFFFSKKKKSYSNPWREREGEGEGEEETKVAGYFFAFTLCIAWKSDWISSSFNLNTNAGRKKKGLRILLLLFFFLKNNCVSISKLPI